MLTSTDGRTTQMEEVREWTSSQEETDSRVVLYLKHAKEMNYKYARVKSPDTDIFFIILYYAASTPEIKVLFDTGSGNRQRLIDITSIAQHHGSEKCTALLACHAFSGCDTTSTFKDIGKVKPIKTMLQHNSYVTTLSKVGEEWNVSDELVDELESFTCAMYGRAQKIKKVNDFRNTRINELCTKDNSLLPSKNIDMSSMPPCKRSFIQHIERVNYQVGIWKRAHIAYPTIPNAASHGWKLENDILQPLWYEGDIVPQLLADMAEDVVNTDEDCDIEDPFLDVEQEFDGYESDEMSSGDEFM